MTYTAPNIAATKHCFFDRFGGVSTGLYESLNFNIKSRDDPENIKKNIAIAAQKYGLEGSCVALVSQDISSHAVYIDKPEQFQTLADGMVTNKENIILGITTADCAPVLFSDTSNGVIGISHAGWRGAVKGIMENTVKLMLERGAELKNIAAAIGPCLQKSSFETKADMSDIFLAQDKVNTNFFEEKDSEHYFFDMEAYLIYRLQKIGIENISASHIDTYADSNYFSYRRNTHLGLINQKSDFPIQLSTITL